MWLIGTDRGEPHEVGVPIRGHIRPVSELLSSARAQRIVGSLALFRHLTAELVIRERVTNGANLAVRPIREKDDITYSIVLHLRGRNKTFIRRNVLGALPLVATRHVEVGRDRHFIPVAIEHLPKWGVAFVRRT